MKHEPNAFLVLGCGCTDCFPCAIFYERLDAQQWGEANCLNPEGFVIKPVYTYHFRDEAFD